MGEKRGLADFECRITVGVQSHGASISQTVTFLKCSRAAVVKMLQD